MNIFSVDFSLSELNAVRQALDVITLSGKDAKFIASLQAKLDGEIQEIHNQLQQHEIDKQQQLIQAIEADKKKSK